MASNISISYFPNGQSKEIAKDIVSVFAENGVSDVFGIEQPKYKSSIKERIGQIAQSQCIVLVICDSYLSKYQDELLEIYSHDSFEERIFPVALNGVELRNSHYLLNHLKGLETEIEQLETAMRGVSLHGQTPIQNELDLLVKKRSCLSEIINTFRQIHIPEIESLIETDYAEVIKAVLKRQKKIATDHALQKIKTSKRIPIEEACLCDRKDQLGTFTENAAQKINACYIHGDDIHGHEAMFNRFCYDLQRAYLKNEAHRKNIKKFNIKLSGVSSRRFEIDMSTKFLSEFGVNPSEGLISQKDLHAVYTSTQIETLNENDIVAVYFRISEREWYDELTNDIEWFVNLCRATTLPDNTPRFYFFFSVVYLSESRDISQKDMAIPSLFDALFDKEKKKQRQRIRKRQQKKQNIIQALKKTIITDINELNWVDADDVREWLSGMKVSSLEGIQLMSAMFNQESPQGYQMDELIPAFKKIIEQINKNYEQNHHT